MLKIRVGLGLIVIWLFLFFNIERLGEPINVSTFVYVMVPIIGALLAFVPLLNRRNVFPIFLIAMTLAHIAIKLAIDAPLFGTALPVTVLELGSLFVSAILFRHVLLIVFEFEDLFQELTFRQMGMPPRIVESLDAEELYREVKRSRRFQNPLVLSILDVNLKGVKLHETRLMNELREIMSARFVQAKLANIVSDGLRDSDYIVQYGSGFAVLMPETVDEDAQSLLNGLRNRVQDELGVALTIGTASFPENAFTLNGLIDYARENAAHSKRTPFANDRYSIEASVPEKAS